jgi:hypothetical protein
MTTTIEDELRKAYDSCKEVLDYKKDKKRCK